MYIPVFFVGAMMGMVVTIFMIVPNSTNDIIITKGRVFELDNSKYQCKKVSSLKWTKE